MISLSIHYCKHVKYEGEEREYLTWYWEEDSCIEGGWNKRPVPNFISSEEKQAREWFRISNQEDSIFIEKELVQCTYWADREKKEILLAEKK